MNATPSMVADINLLSEFLADNQLPDLSTTSPVDCIVICASAVLHGTEILFQTLEQKPSLAKALVLCGGIGHSTELLYKAVKSHPIFSRIADEIQGLPEAKVLEQILDQFFDRSLITKEGCQILLEPLSTNCGQNASFSRKVLDEAGFQATSYIIIQDPTMMLRTKASSEKAYECVQPAVSIMSCPVFVPRVQLSRNGVMEYLGTSPPSELWSQSRFLDLIMGEIPRLRDDNNGYGPQGRDFIAHVDLPSHIEAAWSRLQVVAKSYRQI
ncbi:Protein YdcF [Penicillium digitatum]|uniref:Uncharacterized protein n=3 Tax=Penicillium digitatum TaxID=36651 RepID=K9F5T8_PEND2|nr:hypothetical protein PDIP_33290 [Penicillium digitatum Pd1]EKV04735.1 hypothetical protein PDIG_87270 [Penicillium digitatum PHI26]EKV17049.1 hypothetical protein PDIP_33290 [Penicillium digitatum Pd1]KAG0160125.1 hypothetical protein PDIDSM_7652 [Penicillium digitatum]QQK45774.1 Protein YdcF [Penicillium digitatum]